MSFAADAEPPRSADSAWQVVQGRFDALERADLSSFLAAHHEDVGLYVYPDRPLGSGRDHLE